MITLGNLRHLTLSLQGILNLGDEGFRVIIDAIETLQGLEELVLKISKNQEISLDGVKHLLSSLNNMGSLKKVEISAYLCEKLLELPKMKDMLPNVAEKIFHV